MNPDILGTGNFSFLNKDIPLATPEEHLALDNNEINIPEGEIRKAVDPETFQPCLTYKGKKYLYETFQDIAALGLERYKRYKKLSAEGRLPIGMTNEEMIKLLDNPT